MRAVTSSRLVAGGISFLVVCALLLPLAGVASGQVEVSGRIVVEHGDDFDGGGVESYTVLEAGKERYTLEGIKARGLREGQQVRLRGVRSGGRILLGSGSMVNVESLAAEGDSTASAQSLAAATTSGAATVNKKVAVLLINFVAPTPSPEPSPSASPAPSADPSSSASPAPSPSPSATPSPTPTPPPPAEPWTLSQVRGVYFTNTKSAASYFSELSNGGVSMSGEVFGWYTLVHDTKVCDYNGWASGAKAAAKSAGVNLSSYTNFVYAFPQVAACSWGGLGSVNGPNSWINGKVKMNLFVATHELGHNFGSHHAATLTCYNGSGARVTYSSSCTSKEYGDPFDIMGGAGSYSNTFHLNSYNRKLVATLSTADEQTVTLNGIYRVANAQAAGGTPRNLRVARPSGDYWYLEHRQPYGRFDTFAATSAVVSGVSIRLAPHFKRIPSLLIDTRPDTSSFSDAALAVGRTFTDPIGGVSITTLALDAAGATVRVQVGPDVVAPSAVSGLAASVSGPQSVKLAWSSATDDLEVARYAVQRNGVEIAPTTGTGYTDAGLAQALTYTYTVRAVDGAGNMGAPTAVAVYVPDSFAPSAPASIAGSQAGDRQVGLSWEAATDNVGVTGYRVTRNGAVVLSTPNRWLDDSVVDGWTYRYLVQAFDAAGNLGQPATFEVSLPDVTPPTAPGSEATLAAGPSAAIRWTPATDNVAVAGYTVSRAGVVLATLGGSATTFSESGLSAGTYSYQVAAFDAAGHFGPALATSATVQATDLTPPSVPTGLSTRSRKWRYIDISWQPSTDDRGGTIRYVLFRNKTRIARLTGTSYTDRPVLGTYRYKVRAIDVAGNRSAFSPKVTGTAVRRV